MNLYLVFCVCVGVLSNETQEVYVVAPDPSQAEEGALSLMRKLNYKFSDRVDRIDLIASVSTRTANALLVIHD